jgi:cellulose synthase operon protein C
MKRSHWIAGVILVAAGIVASLMVIPRSRDLAAMRLREGDIRGAGKEYEARVAAGDFSPGVVGGLVRAYREQRQDARAAALLEKYVAGHPEDREALRELAKSYQSAQQIPQYLATLERLNRDKPAQEDLRELSRGYSQTGDIARQAAALERLTRMGGARASDYLDLSWVAEKAGRREDAAKAVAEIARRWPAALDEAGAARGVGIWLEAGRPGQALETAEAWLGANPGPERAAKLAGLFRQKGEAGIAAKLLETGGAGSSPAAVAELARAEAAQGRPEKGFARLEALRRGGTLEGPALEAYLDLALSLGRRDHALDAAVANLAMLGELPAWLAANLAETAAEAGRTDLAARAARVAGAEMERRPLAMAALALARGDRRNALRIADRAAERDLAAAGRIRLAGLYRRLALPEKALRQMEAALPGGPSGARKAVAPPWQPDATLELARLYLETGRATEGWRRFQILAKSNGTPEAQAGRALVGVAAGHPQAAQAWLAGVGARPAGPGFIRDLAQAALDHKQPAVAVAAARILAASGAPGANTLVAEALLAAGKTAEALTEARRSGGSTLLYEQALIAAAPHLPAARDELEKYASRALAAPGLEAARREALLRGLVASGGGAVALDALAAEARRKGGTWLAAYVETAVKAGRRQEAVALLASEMERKDLPGPERETRLALLVHHATPAEAAPQLREFASRGGRWAAAYETALEKAGRAAELTRWWRSRLGDPETTPAERRRIGFRLLDSGDRDGAEAAFLSLARTAGPDSADVKELLYLWGPRPPAAALEWLEARTAASTGDERSEWIAHLTASGAAGRAVRIGAGTAAWTPKLADAWLRALQASGDRAALERALGGRIAAETDPERVRRMARVAASEGCATAALAGFERLLELCPGDGEALREAGKAAYAAGRYQVARRALGGAAEAGAADGEAHFYLGELLASERHPREARREYERALGQLNRVGEKTYRTRKLEANLLFRLGRRAESRRLYETLLKERPDDRHLRADYTATLVEGSEYGKAERILAGE